MADKRETVATIERDEPSSRLAPSPSRMARYDDDFYTWSIEQARALEERRWDDLDLENLADEILALSRTEYRRLHSALARVIEHLLKWDYQPDKRNRSWVFSLREHRRRVLEILGENPGLKSRLSEALITGFSRGRDFALEGTGLPSRDMPSENPYTFDDLMARDITLPED